MPEPSSHEFKPLGPSPIQDPFRARLNLANPWGSGIATGAINTLCMVQNPTTKDGVLYAGAAAGGVWSRTYTGATDSWGTWKWLSSANSYEGAQSISKIKIFSDVSDQWLIAAQGATSSWNNLYGRIENPLQIAERLADGSLRWISNESEKQTLIHGQPITALATADNLVVVGSAEGLYVSSIDPSNGKLAAVVGAGNSDNAINYVTSIVKGESGRLYAAVLGRGIYTTTLTALKANPAEAWSLIESSATLSAGKSMLRLATSSDPVTGEDILFLATAIPDRYDSVSKTIYEDNLPLSAWKTKQLPAGAIGNAQASSHSSFAADPTNPNRVFAGGNWGPPGINPDGTPNFDQPGYLGFTGAVVATDFSGAEPVLVNFFPTKGNETIANNTTVHADSRDFAFMTTISGQMRIIESDDGGVYIKDMQAAQPWQGLNDGLRTTESFYSDWSNIGKLAITAMQDNSVAVGRFNTQPAWLNVTSGDGAIARFDDGVIGSDGIGRAYFGSQSYSGNGYVEVNSYDAYGTLLQSDNLSFNVKDNYGNWQDFKDYDINWYGAKNYPFYLPAETSDFRAGDVVFAGMRNIYEQIIPHWQSVTLGEMALVPLLEDPERKARFFTDVVIGSEKAQGFSKAKPFSWDTLYTSFIEKDFDSEGNIIHVPKFYGRQAGTTSDDWFENKDVYRLKDLSANLPEITNNKTITGVTFNPTNDSEVWATVANSSVMFSLRDTTPSKGSYLIYSADAGKNWNVIAESGKNGIPEYASLQQVVFLPAVNGGAGEIMVGGYGGIWFADKHNDNEPLGNFSSVGWQGLPADSNFNMWNTNLEYDPVDDVLIASIMAQGTWLLNRSNKVLNQIDAIAPGLRINNVTLPQDISGLRNRKNRHIFGSIEVSLQRSDDNLDKAVSVELVLPTDWEKFIELQDLPVQPVNNRVRLDFPKGVNDLSLSIKTVMFDANLPDKIIEFTLENAINSAIAKQSGSVFLYATADLLTLNQEAPGVFYANRSSSEIDNQNQSLVQNFGVLMPRSSLNAGDQLFWFPVNNDGSITDGTTNILPSNPQYIELAKKGFRQIATAGLQRNSSALSPEVLAEILAVPSAILKSEGIAIGELLSTADTSLPSANRFALAFQDNRGNISVSTKEISFNANLLQDNTISFGSSDAGSQVVLAPANGELFVVDELFYYAPSNAGLSHINFNLDVTRGGKYNSGYGLFRVDNKYGEFLYVDGKYLVDAVTGNPTPLSPGSLEYAKEAFKRAQSGVDGITGLPIPSFAESVRSAISLEKGNSYGMFITPNQRLDSPEQLNSLSDILFSIKNANQNLQLQHISMGTGSFAFEDMGYAGDSDFNDMLFAITPAYQKVI